MNPADELAFFNLRAVQCVRCRLRKLLWASICWICWCRDISRRLRHIQSHFITSWVLWSFIAFTAQRVPLVVNIRLRCDFNVLNLNTLVANLSLTGLLWNAKRASCLLITVLMLLGRWLLWIPGQGLSTFTRLLSLHEFRVMVLQTSHIAALAGVLFFYSWKLFLIRVPQGTPRLTHFLPIATRIDHTVPITAIPIVSSKLFEVDIGHIVLIVVQSDHFAIGLCIWRWKLLQLLKMVIHVSIILLQRVFISLISATALLAKVLLNQINGTAPTPILESYISAVLLDLVWTTDFVAQLGHQRLVAGEIGSTA